MEGGDGKRGWSEWRGEENWSLLLTAIHQLRAIVWAQVPWFADAGAALSGRLGEASCAARQRNY